jgi:hypothetical protein
MELGPLNPTLNLASVLKNLDAHKRGSYIILHKNRKFILQIISSKM